MNAWVPVLILAAGGVVVFRTWWTSPKNNRAPAAVIFAVYCVVFATAMKYYSVIVPQSLEALGNKVKGPIKAVDGSKEYAVRDSEAQPEAKEQSVDQAGETKE
jgi:hypothetical protein